MRLRVGCEFGYEVAAPTPATVQVRPRFDPEHRLVSETWASDPALGLDEFTDLYRRWRSEQQQPLQQLGILRDVQHGRAVGGE